MVARTLSMVCNHGLEATDDGPVFQREQKGKETGKEKGKERKKGSL